MEMEMEMELGATDNCWHTLQFGLIKITPVFTQLGRISRVAPSGGVVRRRGKVDNKINYLLKKLISYGLCQDSISWNTLPNLIGDFRRIWVC